MLPSNNPNAKTEKPLLLALGVDFFARIRLYITRVAIATRITPAARSSGMSCALGAQ